MRVLVVRTDENDKRTAVRMMPYNTDEEKRKCFGFINDSQNRDFAEGKLTTYGKTDIGFDITFSQDPVALNAFLADNPEYAKYGRLAFKTDKSEGVAVFKKWDCVETAYKLRLIKPAVYEAICESDRKNITITVENLGCLKNEELLHRIAVNIAEETKADPEIADCLRLGENRKKENRIAYKNWRHPEEDKEYNSITYRNGGEAFSILFDMDMNILTIKYNDHVFQNGKEWIPLDDAMEEFKCKDCLVMIYNKLPEMEFNQWLADMGDSERYMSVKEDFTKFLPNALISEYYPLKELGSGYFTVSYKGLQMAVNIKEGELHDFQFRSFEDCSHKGKWQKDCPDASNALYQAKQMLTYLGRLTESVSDPYKARFEILDSLVGQIRDRVKPDAEFMCEDARVLDALLSECYKSCISLVGASPVKVFDRMTAKELGTLSGLSAGFSAGAPDKAAGVPNSIPKPIRMSPADPAGGSISPAGGSVPVEEQAER